MVVDSKLQAKAEAVVIPSASVDVMDLVTVLHGYGRVSPRDKHFVDTTFFQGGVARNVTRSIAEAWQKTPNLRNIVIIPNDMDEIDFARKAGVQIATPAETAASIRSMDVAQLAAELGPEKTRELVKLLQGFLPAEKNA